MLAAYERAYTGFLRAAASLADASLACQPALSRTGRIVLGAAVLRLGEADRSLGRALASRDRLRLEDAAGRLEVARAALREAERYAVVDAARRRTLRLV
jgi:hypothetical protein